MTEFGAIPPILRAGTEPLVFDGKAVGAVLRVDWTPWDLTTPSGIKVEVKSAAYIQSWSQTGPSKITFSVARKRGVVGDSGVLDNDPRHHAHVYVFALLAETDQTVIDPLDLDQWEFYVVPTSVLEQRERSQHSITLPSLRRLAKELTWAQLADAVEHPQAYLA
ncbi:hypothetical protein JZU48_02225 [bacterium]|nr:hypothetical protein [bacterium]